MNIERHLTGIDEQLAARHYLQCHPNNIRRFIRYETRQCFEHCWSIYTKREIGAIYFPKSRKGLFGNYKLADTGFFTYDSKTFVTTLKTFARQEKLVRINYIQAWRRARIVLSDGCSGVGGWYVEYKFGRSFTEYY